MRRPLELLHERFATRSVDNFISRVYSISKHYGLDVHKYKRSLLDFINLMKKYNFKPTLPVTAIVLEKNPNLFHYLQSLGVEFAVHGYLHIDYSNMDKDTLFAHLKNAKEIFQRNNISFSGFRYPYLRKDKEKINFLAKSGFEWDSSQVVSWFFYKKDIFPENIWKNYQRILATYEPIDNETFFTLPYFIDGMVEIPVSVPDDEILIERLRLHDGGYVQSIWENMFHETIRNREMMILQVHPERFYNYRFALEHLLNLSSLNKDAWTASLGEIAEWWKERNNFQFQVKKISNNRFRVLSNTTERATILIKNGLLNSRRKMDNYTIITGNHWEISSPVQPVIGVDPDSNMKIMQFLKEEGFPCEIISDSSLQYAFSINHRGKLTYKDKRHYLDSINNCPNPVFRFWRWPYNNKACFAVTGDIDSVNIWDFFTRFYSPTGIK